MTKAVILIAMILILQKMNLSHSFAVMSTPQHYMQLKHKTSSSMWMSLGECNSVEDFLEAVHNSKFQFRVVVIGNGSILETTQVLGPVMKYSDSPKTGERLVTFASTNQEFEFHVKLGQIKEISFVERNELNICRLINNKGESACSLILVDKSDDALAWFQTTKSQYEGQ